MSSATVKALNPQDGTMANDPTTAITKTFVYFLQNLFRSQFEEGSGMCWIPDEENTEIIITNEKPVLTAVEKLPHIVVLFGACRWAGLGLDQLQGQGALSEDGSHFYHAQRTHTDLIPSTVTYHCQAKHGMVAKRIAWNASKFTNVFRRVIMKYGKLHHVGVKHDISAESPATAYTGPLSLPEIVSVMVTVPFFWQDQWRIRPATGTLFEKMSIALGANDIMSMYSAGRSAKINPPRIRGREVSTVPITQQVLIEE